MHISASTTRISTGSERGGPRSGAADMKKKRRAAAASHFCFKCRMTIHVVMQDKSILMADRTMDTVSVSMRHAPEHKCGIMKVTMLGGVRVPLTPLLCRSLTTFATAAAALFALRSLFLLPKFFHEQ